MTRSPFPVQVNGKTRAVVNLPADVSKEEALAAGKEAAADKITGTVVKEIYVPGKLVNIVAKRLIFYRFFRRKTT